MADLREFMRYLFGGAVCLSLLSLCLITWFGLTAQFGILAAMTMLVGGAMLGLNFGFALGMFCCAFTLWHWSIVPAIGFAVPGLLLLQPSHIGRVLGITVVDGMLPWLMARQLERTGIPGAAELERSRRR